MTYTTEPTARPCIALMGEFSAGKSTLANLLIGSNPLPVRVVATQLPPVRISYGDNEPYAIDLSGHQRAVDLHHLGAVGLDDIAYLQLFCEEELLTHCDLLDMPGISDPNMDPEVWERMIDTAHGVIWCSHATQAWRQSEAAVWAEMPPEIYPHSLLLLTRADKLTTAEDRNRVVQRVRRETAGLFADVLPISLLQATSAKEDNDAWQSSGAEAFAAALIALLAGIGAAGSAPAPRLPGLERPPSAGPSTPPPGATGAVTPRRVQARPAASPRPPAGLPDTHGAIQAPRTD